MFKFKSLVYIILATLWLPIANAQYNWANLGQEATFKNSSNPTVLVPYNPIVYKHQFPYVRYDNYNKVPASSYLASYKSSSWALVPQANGAVIALSPTNGSIYQASLESSVDGQPKQIAISRVFYNSISPFDTQDLKTNSLNFQLLVSKDNIPYIAYSDATKGNALVVKRYNYATGSWQTVGGSGPSTGYSNDMSKAVFSLVMSHDGTTVYVSYPYYDQYLNATPFIAKSVNNGPWERVGSEFANPLSIDSVPVALALDDNDNLFIAYQGHMQSYNQFTLKVQKYVNKGPYEQWDDVGTLPYIGFDKIHSIPKIAIDKQGQIFVAYDGAPYDDKSSSIGVLVFQNSEWQTIQTSTNSGQPSIALADDGTVYLSYTKNYLSGQQGNLVVLKGTQQ